jgi:hypothetical protein
LKMRRDNASLSHHHLSTLYALSLSLSLSLSLPTLFLSGAARRSFAFAKNGAKEQARKPRHRYRLPPSLHVCAIKNCCVVFLHVCRRGSERQSQSFLLGWTFCWSLFRPPPSWGSPRLRLELLLAPISSFFPFSLAVLGLHFCFVSLPLSRG